MRPLGIIVWTVCKVTIAAFALSFVTLPADATEKYWIAHEAQLVVVGTLHAGSGYWWLDGWHETGTISVDEVIYGHGPSNRISFRFTGSCYMRWWHRWWPTHSMTQLTERGLWFLRAVDERTWEPANSCDSGCRFLSQRADFEQYIRLHKH